MPITKPCGRLHSFSTLNAESVAETASIAARWKSWLSKSWACSESVAVRWRAELRYAGQGFELPVELTPDGTGADEVQQIRERFEREYRRTYGHELEGAAIDFVALRVVASVPPQSAAGASRMSRSRHRAPTARSRSAYFGKEHGLHETPVIARHDLTSTPRRGPADHRGIRGHHRRAASCERGCSTRTTTSSSRLERVAAVRRDPDPILLEVFRNAFEAIADQMALILMTTAYSPIVRDAMDFSTALCDAAGSQPRARPDDADAPRQLLRRHAPPHRPVRRPDRAGRRVHR